MKNKAEQLNLADLLLAFRRNIVKGMRKDGLKHELTFSQVEVLRFVGHDGKKTMKSIASYLKITPPSTTAIVVEMEKKGLVVRRSEKSDKRVVYIELTKNTKKLYGSLCKRKEAILEKMVSKLSASDQKNLSRIIRILIEA